MVLDDHLLMVRVSTVLNDHLLMVRVCMVLDDHLLMVRVCTVPVQETRSLLLKDQRTRVNTRKWTMDIRYLSA